MKKRKAGKRKQRHTLEDISELTDKRKVNKYLAAEIREYLPHVTDLVHMKVAIALNCDYKVVKAYLAGNIEDEDVARQLIRHLGAIIEDGYDSFKHEVDVQDAVYKFVDIAGSVLNTWKLCNSSHTRLAGIQSRIINNYTSLETILNGIDQKLDLITVAGK